MENNDIFGGLSNALNNGVTLTHRVEVPWYVYVGISLAVIVPIVVYFAIKRS
jgi:hypothetical protein